MENGSVIGPLRRFDPATETSQASRLLTEINLTLVLMYPVVQVICILTFADKPVVQYNMHMHSIC